MLQKTCLIEQRLHLGFFLSEPVAFRRVYGLESYSRTSGESNHHRQSVNATRVTSYQLSHEGNYKDFILGDYVWGLSSTDLNGQQIQTPSWSLVLSYEHAVRKRAYSLMLTERLMLDAALEKAWKCPTTKERHIPHPSCTPQLPTKAAQCSRIVARLCHALGGSFQTACSTRTPDEVKPRPTPRPTACHCPGSFRLLQRSYC